MKLILVGNGRFGSLYKQTVQRHTRGTLVGIVDKNAERLDKDVEVHALDLHNMIDNVDFDAVIIATPPQHHYEIALRALTAGKHVMCAKPGSLNMADMMELEAVAAKHKVRLMVDYTMLAAPENNVIDGLFSTLGEPRHMHSIRFVAGAPRKENIIFDLLCHDIALFLYHNPDKIITRVECNTHDDITFAKLFNDQNRRVALLSARYSETPKRKVQFALDTHPFFDPAVTITWDQVDRELRVESAPGEKLVLEFRKHPDPLTLALDRFVLDTYGGPPPSRVLSVCEMLTEAHTTGSEVLAP